jgi:hypothetical protein
MSTNDVPGARPENRDVLATGCWAEHEDGSLIFVESTEGGRVIYSIFEMSTKPPIEYRDAMAEGAFKKQFSWQPEDGKTKDRWTWHDKTPFPWDRIIKKGARDGRRDVSAEETLTAAARIRRSREIRRGRAVDDAEVEARVDKLSEKATSIIKKLQRAINQMGK